MAAAVDVDLAALEGADTVAAVLVPCMASPPEWMSMGRRLIP
jgi:hypothetical protein